MEARPGVVRSEHVPTMWRREDVPDLPRRSGPVIVAGSALNNTDEVEAARALRPGAPIFGASGGGSAHPDVFHVVARDRQAYGYRWLRESLEECVVLAGVRPWRYHASLFNDKHAQRMKAIFAAPQTPVLPSECGEWWAVDYWWEASHDIRGTSLMTTVCACAALGYDEIIVAGAPQNGTGGHRLYEPGHRGAQFYYGATDGVAQDSLDRAREAWKAMGPKLGAKLRGMSGLIHDLYGPPADRLKGAA